MRNILQYKNGNYIVLLDCDDGTKIRCNDEAEFIPDYPESIDVTISKRCLIGCDYCYAGCTPNGKEANIMAYSFIDNLPPYTELALNGNEPLHSQLVPFLLKCKKLKLVPSLTVNQYTFMKNLKFLKELTDDELLYGLGVSLVNPTQDFIDAVKSFPNAVIHIVNGICEMWKLKAIAENGLKILILGYKDFGRGAGYYNQNTEVTECNKKTLYDALPNMVNGGWFEVVAFDNLALEQLEVKRIVSEEDWLRYYMGADGRYSMYIDMVDGMFYKNSMSDTGYRVTDDIIEMFKVIRDENRD